MEPQAAKAADTAQLPGLLARRLRHPPTLHMVMEALRAQDERKGTSVVAIKRFILAKYPSVDPIRLKYLLKQALSKGLSRGDLVRPHNSSAVGATGRFKLAPEKLRQKQPPGKADPDGEQPLKAARKGTTKPPRAPAAGAQQRGATKEKSTAAKQKLKPVAVQPPAAAQPRSDGAKPPQAAGRPRFPGKGRSGPSKAPAAEDAGQGGGNNPAGARAKGPRKALAGKSKENLPQEAQQDGPKEKGAKGKVPRKAPAGKSKEKVPKEIQQDGPKEKGVKGKARKPRVTVGAGQGEARPRKAAPCPADKKDL